MPDTAHLPLSEFRASCKKRPEQILPDISHNAQAVAQRPRNTRKIIAHEYDVSRIYGYISTSSRRNTYIGSRKRRRLVNPVSHHGNAMTALLKPAHLIFLVIRQNFRQSPPVAHSLGSTAACPALKVFSHRNQRRIMEADSK